MTRFLNIFKTNYRCAFDTNSTDIPVKRTNVFKEIILVYCPAVENGSDLHGIDKKVKKETWQAFQPVVQCNDSNMSNSLKSIAML